jgi:DNA-binding NtrC family response regulator
MKSHPAFPGEKGERNEHREKPFMQMTPGLISFPLSNSILFVGPRAEDHQRLSEILASVADPSEPASPWTLETSRSLEEAIGVLQRSRMGVVLCDTELGNASWQELLEEVNQLDEPPSLIVTSRVADEYLWAEALNLGAYDVLAKPFDTGEVVRVVHSAWRRRNQPAVKPANNPCLPRRGARTAM